MCMTPAWRVRAGAVTLALPLLITLCLPGATMAQVVARQQAPPGGSSGASVVKTGWWWRVNEAPTGQVPVAPPQAAPPTVPAGALPAAAAAGEPEKVAAIEFALDASPGATVSSFVVTLRESSAPGTNVGNDTAKVVACPVTEPFWTEGEAASWQARPDYDCELASAAGTRAANGVWTFDLTSIASEWLAADSTMSPSIVLVEQAEPPESFQVAYDGSDAGGIGVRLVATPAPSEGGDDGDGGFGDSGPVGGGSGGAVDDGLGSSGSVPEDAGAAPGEEVPGAAAPPVTAGDEPEVAQPEPAATAMPALFDNIPATALALIPVGLIAAYLVMLALGPQGEPATSTTRRGVSRALDLRRARRVLDRKVP